MDGSVMGINALFVLNYALPSYGVLALVLGRHNAGQRRIAHRGGMLPPIWGILITPSGGILWLCGALYPTGKEPLPLVSLSQRRFPLIQNRTKAINLGIKAGSPNKAPLSQRLFPLLGQDKRPSSRYKGRLTQQNALGGERNTHGGHLTEALRHQSFS
jgi:hypothetical protein